MDGELAQGIALAAHGSVWLAGVTTDSPPALDSGNSTFQYVGRVRFELRRSRSRRRSTAQGVTAWLQGARARRIDRLWLDIPDPGVTNVEGREIGDWLLRAFVNAGTWSLLGTSHTGPAETWHASWALGDANAPDNRIWEVEYHGTSLDRAVEPVRPDLSSASERLGVALEAAEGFARRQELAEWADWFVESRRLGERDDSEPPYHPDMLPARGFPGPARQLLAMATHAWVFGGMGSWGDLVFPTQRQHDEYDRISAELYSAVLHAFVASVNVRLEA